MRSRSFTKPETERQSVGRPLRCASLVALSLSFVPGCVVPIRPPEAQPAPPPSGAASTGAAVAPSAPPPAPGFATADAQDSYSPHDEEPPEDGIEHTEPLQRSHVVVPHPLDGKTPAELEALLASDPAALGSMSIGSTNGGTLFNAVQMPPGDHHHLVDQAHAWGTQETVDALLRSIAAVEAAFPGSAPLPIGHLSARRGGALSPHVSHQTGRDADVGYYYIDGGRWYARAHARNLDRQRTWAFVRTLITETDVDLILIDHSIQRLLEEYARSIGEDPEWLDSIFRGVPGKLPPLIRHARGHATHLHVRFFNPIAQETGRRMLETLVRKKLIEPPIRHAHHKVKKGETLGMLARKYRTTVPAIKRANGLRSTLIRAGKVYLIPRPSGLRTSPYPVSIPPRRLPPRPIADALPRSSMKPTIVP